MLYLSSLHRPLEASAYPPIPVHGAEGAYEQFDLIFTEDQRERLAATAQSLARIVRPDISDEDTLVSCFHGGYAPEDMDTTDGAKLSVGSSVPAGGFLEIGASSEYGFGGDDSNRANIIERDRQALRDQRAAIHLELQRAYDEGTLTESMRQQARIRSHRINQKIKQLGERKITEQVPVYYATALSGLRTDGPEDNPMAYSGEVPGTSNMVLYDATAIRQDARLRLDAKSDEQFRIVGRGQDIMSHALAVVQLVFR